jgi:hypothetical protein
MTERMARFFAPSLGSSESALRRPAGGRKAVWSENGWDGEGEGDGCG